MRYRLCSKIILQKGTFAHILLRSEGDFCNKNENSSCAKKQDNKTLDRVIKLSKLDGVLEKNQKSNWSKTFKLIFVVKNNVFLFCVKNYGVFFVVFFFADKMYFKLPKLDGFKITVILVLGCYRGISKDGDTRCGILWCHSP